MRDSKNRSWTHLKGSLWHRGRTHQFQHHNLHNCRPLTYRRLIITLGRVLHHWRSSGNRNKKKRTQRMKPYYKMNKMIKGKRMNSARAISKWKKTTE